MANRHDKPYTLFKRGNVYHAYISFLQENGERIQFRGSTRQVLPEKAAQFCLKFIAQQETQTKLRAGKAVKITSDEAFTSFFENNESSCNSKNITTLL